MRKAGLKAISLVMSLLLLSACGGSKSANSAPKADLAANSSETVEQEEQQAVEETSSVLWTVEGSVDEFGDARKDGDVVARQVITGDFSNTATSGSELNGYVFISKQGLSNHYFVTFRLFEYGDMKAVFSTSEEKNIVLKTKINDSISTYSLVGQAPNSDLILGVSDFSADEIVNPLFEGTDVRCIIKIGNSQYNFTVYASNFNVIKEHIKSSKENKIDAQIASISKEDAIAEVISNYLSGTKTDYEKEVLSTYYDELVSLNNDELAELFPGRYGLYAITDAENPYYEFRADGTIINLGRIVGSKYTSKDEINPNWDDVEGTWSIENNRLNFNKRIPRSYFVKNLEVEGCYLINASKDEDYFNVNYSYVLIKYYEDNTPAI